METIRDEGLLVLNRDDHGLCDRAANHTGPIEWFGVEHECVWHSEGAEKLSDGRWRFSVRGVAVELQIPGRHMINNALAAVAAAASLGVPVETAAAKISHTEAAERRMRSFWLKDILILDDAYNANPSSMRAALQTLQELPSRSGREALRCSGWHGRAW